MNDIDEILFKKEYHDIDKTAELFERIIRIEKKKKGLLDEDNEEKNKEPKGD